MSLLKFKFKYQQQRSVEDEKLYSCKDKLFISAHWLTVILITSGSFFTGISNTDVKIYNMTQYCDSEEFNQLATPVNRKWPVITLMSVSFLVTGLLAIRMFTHALMLKDLLEILNYYLGFLMSWDITYMLQTIISYPIPSFFENKDLQCFYCCPKCPIVITKTFLKEDMESRGSFPSFLVCANAYATVYLFLLTCYLDEGKRFAAKLLAILIPGTITFVYGWTLYQNNENHLQDVIGGAIIGGLLAAYIHKNCFRKNSKLVDRFGDDFVSVVMEREIELAQMNSTQPGENSTEEVRNGPNEYTINLYPHENSNVQPIPVLDDRPPPYLSVISPLMNE